jgi:hypothetical protein
MHFIILNTIVITAIAYAIQLALAKRAYNYMRQKPELREPMMEALIKACYKSQR